MSEITEKGQTVKSTTLLSSTASGMLSESEALSKDTHERSGRANEERFVFSPSVVSLLGSEPRYSVFTSRLFVLRFSVPVFSRGTCV